jgi:hypothetical protein
MPISYCQCLLDDLEDLFLLDTICKNAWSLGFTVHADINSTRIYIFEFEYTSVVVVKSEVA